VPPAAETASPSQPSIGSLLLRAGLLTGFCDGLFSISLAVLAYHSTVQRLFQGVASTLLGPGALDGGPRTAIIGVLMHIGVAFGWSTVFLLLLLQSAAIRALLARPYGVIAVASLYGPFVWLVMSLAVIPLLRHRAPAISLRWWIQLVGHFPFVGLPIVASIGRGLSRAATPGQRGEAHG